MKIERIYITGCRTDLHLTRCCVASIRRWYPSIPISLVKDELRGRFQRDCYDSYVLTPTEARTDLGVDLVPRLNGGLVAFPPGDLDPAECERYLAHPRLARLHYHTEQTLLALCASAHGAARYLPASYRLDMEPCAQPETLVAGHYVSPVRPLLFEEGMTRLAALGFLDALRRRDPRRPPCEAPPPIRWA